MEYAKPPRMGPQPCSHCPRKMEHPIWTRVGDNEYVVFCDICKYRMEWEFTAENAISQARAIIAAEPLIIRPRQKVGPR